jgi:hypothetical protein
MVWSDREQKDTFSHKDEMGQIIGGSARSIGKKKKKRKDRKKARSKKCPQDCSLPRHHLLKLPLLHARDSLAQRLVRHRLAGDTFFVSLAPFKFFTGATLSMIRQRAKQRQVSPSALSPIHILRCAFPTLSAGRAASAPCWPFWAAPLAGFGWAPSPAASSSAVCSIIAACSGAVWKYWSAHRPNTSGRR